MRSWAHTRKTSGNYLKARMATELPVPTSGGVYITVKDEDKSGTIELAKRLQEMGFKIHATPGYRIRTQKRSVH